ncbi:MAG: HD domain-containing protein [Christensenellaceae bacterium]|jgi:HD-GYP domain-containing protein (c-di-GMP phosphodiesterase class II)|nr:HD domain-containing protein [Christensenellaceae bacterium]
METEIQKFAENVKFFNKLTLDVFEREGLDKSDLFATLQAASSLQRRLYTQNNSFIDSKVTPLIRRTEMLTRAEADFLKTLALALYDSDEKRFDDPCFTTELWERYIQNELLLYGISPSEKSLAEVFWALKYHYYSILDTASPLYYARSVSFFEKVFNSVAIPKAAEIADKRLVGEIVNAICLYYPCIVYDALYNEVNKETVETIRNAAVKAHAMVHEFLGEGEDYERVKETVEYALRDSFGAAMRLRLQENLGDESHISEAKKILQENYRFLPDDLLPVICGEASFPQHTKHIKHVNDTLNTFYDELLLSYFTGEMSHKHFTDVLISFGEFVVKYTKRSEHSFFVSSLLDSLALLTRTEKDFSDDIRRRYENLVAAFVKYVSVKKAVSLNTLFGSLRDLQSVMLLHSRREFPDDSFAARKKYVSLITGSLLRTHVPTFVHSLMVAKMMKTAAEWFCDNKPSKLIGICNAATEEEVKAKKAEIVSQVYLCGLAHDLGKINYIDTVSKVCRKLTDMEFLMIKKHCKGGTEVLSSAEFENESYVAKYHHRTAHGKSAREYPKETEDENFASHPYFFVVKMCYVFDGLDAATDFVGRGYQSCKSPELAMDETVADSAYRLRAEAKWASKGVKQAAFYTDCDPEITALFTIPAFRSKIKTILNTYRKTVYERVYRNSSRTIE